MVLAILMLSALSVLFSMYSGEVLLANVEKTVFFSSDPSCAHVLELVLIPFELILLMLNFHH